MKKRNSQESTDDKVLGKVIAAELRSQVHEADTDCPETEVVAAFYDRTLTEKERVVWEKHFLHCMRCQEYLAEMARLSDADEPPPLLHEAAAEEEGAAGGWFFRMAWVAPFLVVAITAAVWYRDRIALYLPGRDEIAQSVSLPEGPSADETPSLPEPSSAPAAAKLEKDSETGSPRRQEESPSVKPKEAAAGVVTMAANMPPASPESRSDLQDSSALARDRAEANEGESMAKKSIAAISPPVPSSVAPSTETVEVAESKTPSGTGAFGRLTVRGAQEKVDAKWRVGRRGAIQKADGTGGWTRIPSGVDDDLFDITFEEMTGWAVGHGGTVLRSLDGGNTWAQVTSPTAEDLIHVSTRGPQQATVIARSGKTYSTSNGGQSWN